MSGCSQSVCCLQMCSSCVEWAMKKKRGDWWNGRLASLRLWCRYPGSDVVHSSADAAGQPLQDWADTAANYQSHSSWRRWWRRRRRRWKYQQRWPSGQLHTRRSESLSSPLRRSLHVNTLRLVFSQVSCWWYYRPLSFSLVRNLDNELCLIIHQVVTAATFLYIFHCCSVWQGVIFLVFHTVTAARCRVGSWFMIRKPEVKNHVWKKICNSHPFLPHPNVKQPHYDFTMKMVGIEIRLKGEASSFITLDIYHYYILQYKYNSNKSRAPRNILYLPDFKRPLKKCNKFNKNKNFSDRKH